ncbi:MAG: hypothetical protein AAFQ07_08060, partial [Chloroflexota bacterium]
NIVIIKAIHLKNATIIFHSSTAKDDNSCIVYPMEIEVRDYIWRDYLIGADAFFTPAIDYALQGQELAILNDGQTITVNGDILRVESEAPLIEIRWLPQLFYGDENRFPLYPPIDTRPESEQSEAVSS